MPKKATAARGPALVAAIDAALLRPASPIGDAVPLDDAGVRAAEDAAGVALSPSMATLLLRDVGWIRRAYGWFDDAGHLVARPFVELVDAHAGPNAEGFADIVARFPARALPLDAGSDSARFLYLGDPDEHGEYPVVWIDHDDLPALGVEHPGFDVWLAREVGVSPGNVKADVDATHKRLFGRKTAWTLDSPGRPTAPVPGPPPGSVAHARPAPAKPGKARALTDKQLDKALAERAGDGDVVRLQQLIADAIARKRPKAALDAALIEAAKGGRVDALRALLAAGASPNAREYYGHALSRAVVYGAGLATIDALLAAGARPDGDGVNGQTSLFSAIERSDAAVVARLIAAGANVNRAESNRMRPLHHAATADDASLLPMLLAAGAEPNGGDHFRTPLLLAVERGRDDAVARLIAAGADVNRPSGYLAATPLHVALEHGRDAIAAALVRAGASRDAVDERGITAGEAYGPAGDDARQLSFPTQAVTGPLTCRLRVAVFNATAFGQGPAELQPARWAELINGGLAGALARATVRDTPALRSGAGVHELEATLDVVEVDPRFFHVLAGTLWSLRGACRVLALSLDAPGVPTVSGEEARATLAAPPVIPDVDAPIPIEVVSEGPPSVVLRLRTERPAPAWDDPLVTAVNRAFGVWQASVATWGPGPALGPMCSTAVGGKGAVREIVVALNVFDGGKVAKRLPWETAGMLVALRAVLGRLHQEFPLAGAVLRLG